MRHHNIVLVFFIWLLSVCSSTALALRHAKPTPVDGRIKIMVYSPNDVFTYTGYYGYQASMVFADDEEVQNISMGDSTAWQIIPSGNKIFLKPIEDDATTNMTLTTNQRTYFFELYAEEIEDMRDPNMVFTIRFIYPSEADHKMMQTFTAQESIVDQDRPEKYNFFYSLSGSDEIAPIKIFDDGEFTYLYFRDKNAEMPAIFSVDENLKESMVNYRLSGDGKNMIIIEHVYPKLSLRLDDKITCIFNEAYGLQ